MEVTEINQQVAEIKQYLKRNKITYEELSKLSSVSIGTLKSVFSGRTASPRLDTVQLIQRALGLPEWTADEKALGVGEHTTTLSEEETEWLELRSEILEVGGKDYLNAVYNLIKTITKNLNSKKDNKS